MLLLHRPIIVFASVAMVPADAVTQARADRPAPEVPEVRTAATVQRNVQPNLATVTLQFSADGSSPKEAGRHLASRVDSLRQALATLGIPRDSIVNRNQWYWWRGRIETVVGPVRYAPRSKPGSDPRFNYPVQDTTYRAHDAVEVRIRDLSKIGAVLDTALGRGITDISNVRFAATEVAAAQDQALRAAAVRARAQAVAIATASGLQLGRVLSLSTQADYADRFDEFTLSGAVATGTEGQEGVATVVVQPSVPVSVTVYGRWELVSKP